MRPSGRNNVAPSRFRILEKKTDKFLGFGNYMVDSEAIPGLVARGVLRFKFMLDRADFESRFGLCKDACGVRMILAGEGFYDD